ncbi:MAG TPA: sigma-54 dependent transcriptional regulator [Nitrospiria bacterium]|jgi:two-component system nitrogen regulation response regulator NtrX
MAENILIVDDERNILTTLSAVLKDEGYDITVCENGMEALKIAKQDPPALVLLDIWMEEWDGLETLKRLKEVVPKLIVIMMSGHGSIETAVRAIKLGAYDYIEKPLSLEKVTLMIRNALHQQRLEEENFRLRERMHQRFEMIGKSPVMEELKEQIRISGPTNSRVLISGENGTGKELVARNLHDCGLRRDQPFVEVNCAAIPETLIESELFGYEKGAFTGAQGTRKGRFELAHQGTLFLDEIADMSLPTQAKVLRVLQEQQFNRVGGGRLIQADVRVIAASNKDLMEEIEKGNFREDLFYRLNVIPLSVPPLRERGADIPLLTDYFLKQLSGEQGIKVKTISPDGMKLLQEYSWPGNVRELRNVVERLLIMVPSSVISGEAVSNVFKGASLSKPGPETSSPEHVSSLREARAEFERRFIHKKLCANNWNISKTAEELQIERSNLHRKIKSLNIEQEHK